MNGLEMIVALRQLADSMEKHRPDFELRDRIIPVLITWSVNNDHDSDDILARLGDVLGGNKLRQLAEKADAVMQHMEKYGPGGWPHLCDTDDNDGQRLRKAIEQVLGVRG